MTKQGAIAVFGIPLIGLLGSLLFMFIKDSMRRGLEQKKQQEMLNEAARKQIVQARLNHDKIMSEIAAGVDDARASELLSKPPSLPERPATKAPTTKKSLRSKMRGIRGR